MKCFLFAQQKLGLFKVFQVEYGREHFVGLGCSGLMPKCLNKCIDNIRPEIRGMGHRKAHLVRVGWMGLFSVGKDAQF